MAKRAATTKQTGGRGSTASRGVAVRDSGKRSVSVNDGLENLLSGQGTFGDKTTHTKWVASEINQSELEAAYRSDWIARKIIDIPPADATREWRSWQGDADQITLLEEAEAAYFLKQKVRQAMRKARLYGGALLVMNVDQGMPHEELNIEAVGKGALKHVHVAARHEIAAGPIAQDIESKWYGTPEYYTRTGQGSMLRIHPSRVVRFIGAESPNELLTNGWGDSVLQVVETAVKSSGVVTGGIAQMVQEAQVDVIGIPELTTNLSVADYEAGLKRRFALAANAKSLWNMLLLDKDEDWQRITSNFSALPDVLRMFLMIVSGAADIPATRMFGQSPQGMSATGDSDTRNYYDRISNDQRNDIQPLLNPLDQVLVRSALGEWPEGMFYNWNSLWQLDDAQKADLAVKRASVFKTDVDAGMIDSAVLKEARQNQLIEDGTYPGLEQIIGDLGEGDDEGRADPVQTEGTVAPEPSAATETAQETALNGAQITAIQGVVQAVALGSMPLETAREMIRIGFPVVSPDLIARMLEPLRSFTPALPANENEVARIAAQTDRLLRDAMPRTMYVYRKVKNASDIIRWAKSQGIENLMAVDQLHVTLVWSDTKVDWMKAGDPDFSQTEDGTLRIAPGGVRIVEQLGGATTLLFASSALSYRHMNILHCTGAETKWPDYQPHITLSWWQQATDLTKVEPYRGEIILGPEVFEEADDNWRDRVVLDAMFG